MSLNARPPQRRGQWLRRAAAFLALITLTVACSETSGTGGAAATAANGKGEVTGNIRVAWWGGKDRNEVTNEVVDLFDRRHKNVTVGRETADFAGYWERLKVQASSDNMPCVTQTQGRQLQDLTNYNLLLPLDPMVKSGAIDVDHVPKDVLDSGRGADGKLYMIPYGSAYDALMLNRTLAEQSGVELPPAGYSWNEFFAWIAKAQSALPNGMPAANLGGGVPNYLISYLYAHGNQLFDNGKLGFSRKVLADYWRSWEDLRKNGATTSPAQVSEEPESAEQTYVARGQVMADVMPGNYLEPANETIAGQGLDQELVTRPLPSGPAGTGNVLITSGFSIPVSCRNVPTSAAFVDFWLNNDEGAKTYASSNGAVANARQLRQQLRDPELSEEKQHELNLYRRIVDMSPQTVLFPPGYQDIFERAFTREYEQIAFGRKSIEQAVHDFFAEANAGLRQQ